MPHQTKQDHVKDRISSPVNTRLNTYRSSSVPLRYIGLPPVSSIRPTLRNSVVFVPVPEVADPLN